MTICGSFAIVSKTTTLGSIGKPTVQKCKIGDLAVVIRVLDKDMLFIPTDAVVVFCRREIGWLYPYELKVL